MKKEHIRNTYWQKNEGRKSIEKEEQDKPLNFKAPKQTLIFRPFKGLSTVQAAILSLVISFKYDRKGSKQLMLTNKTIGKKLRISEGAAKAAVRQLRDKGYVKNFMRHSRGRNLVTRSGAYDIPKDFCHVQLPIYYNIRYSLVEATIKQYNMALDDDKRNGVPTLKLIKQKTGLSDKTARKYLKQVLQVHECLKSLSLLV